MRLSALFAAAAAVSLSVGISAQNQPIRIHAATLVDGAGKVLHNATVVVQGTKITAVETAAGGPATYELGRLTMMPGMIDVHAHLGWHFGPDGRYQPRSDSAAQDILYSAE